MSDVHYIFEKRFSKVQDEAEVKVALQRLLCTNCENATTTNKILSTKGNELFEVVWGNNLGLRTSLFPNLDYANNTLDELKPEAIVLFKAVVGSTSNSFYNFIKVK